MLMVISPSKSLKKNISIPEQLLQHLNKPKFLDGSNVIIRELRRLSAQEVAQLMKISQKLALLNTERFSQWHINYNWPTAIPAAFYFDGDVYDGLSFALLSQSQVEWANQHLRILSGLYGLLKPLDLILPYRLEMGTPTTAILGTSLHQFWQDKVTSSINVQLHQNGQLLVNLASEEYFKAINLKTVNAKYIQPVFKDEKNGEFKVISFYAKRARGMMARYIVENQITDEALLKNFNASGYYFVKEEPLKNGGLKFVFHRRQQV